MIGLNPKRSLSRKASQQLDLVRGVAALVVMVGHLRGLFFVTYSHVSHPNPVAALGYALSSRGHQAVMVFFVLSGYLVGGSALATFSESKWDTGKYALNRLTRLYVVLIPALILGYALDHTGIALFGLHGVYGGHYPFIIYWPVRSRLGWSTFLGNLAFLQTIKVNTLGSNGALWSLANEFWYYVAFPVALAAVLRRRMSERLIYIAALIVMGAFVGWPIVEYGLIWLLGVVVAALPPARPFSLPLVRWLIWVALAVSVVIAPRMLGGFAPDLIVGLIFALLLLCLVNVQGQKMAFGGLATGLAAMSYTLYGIHLPVLVFIRGGLERWGSRLWQPGPASVLTAGCIAVGVLAFAYLIAAVTERRTDDVRRWLGGRTPSLSRLRKSTS